MDTLTLRVAPPHPTPSEAVATAVGPRHGRAVLVVLVVVGAVLRVWQATTHGLTFDESFTAMAARLPAAQVVEHLRVADSHPPLDYLLRSPFASAGMADLWLRLPSLVFSIAALALFARWMVRRGTAGLVATALFAASPFLILHGAEARMYALLQLVGVAGAMVAEARLRSPAGWQCWAAAALVVVATFDHVSGLLLAAGLIAVVGIRRARADWVWRGAVVGGVAVWAVLWGPVFADQAGNDWSGWIPPTSPSAFVDAIGGQVTNVTGLRLVLVLAATAGGLVLWRADRRLGQVWLACGALPFVLAGLVGIVSPFLIDRTLTVAAWAAPLALGVLADAAIRRGGRIVATAVVVVLAFGVVAAVSAVAGTDNDADRAVEHLEAVVRPGDTIATVPTRVATLAAYEIGVEQWRRPREVEIPGIRGASAFRDTAVPATGRVWLFSPGAFADESYPGYEACPGAASWRRGPMTVDCWDPVGE